MLKSIQKIGLVAFLFALALFASQSTFAVTQINLAKALNTPANPIPSGQEFTYNLAWSCPGSVTPNDDCIDMQISDPLPLTIQATLLPNPDGKLSKVCVQNPGDPIPNFITCSQPVVNTNNPTVVGATLYFVFVNRVTAGDSGSLSLNARFPAGISTNGDTATNEATITGKCDIAADAGCVDPVPKTSASPEITVTAVDKTTINKTVLLNGAIDYDTIYRIEVCPTANPANDTGFINPQNVVVTDTLPVDATFVSANPVENGVVGNVYTWNIANLSSCQNIDITVKYNAGGSNFIGASKQNDAEFTYDPIDATPLPKTDSSTHVLAGPSPGLSRSKGVSDSIVNPTQNTVFNVRAINNGNLPLGIKITDPLPSFCQVQSFNVNRDEDATAYTITLKDGTVITSAALGDVPPSSGEILATTIHANALDAPPSGSQIAQIEVEYGDAGDPRIFPNARVRLDVTCEVMDPDRDNIALVLPAIQTNTATILGENGAVTTTADSSRNITIRALGANPTFQPDATKTQVPVATIIPGNNVTFNIAMTNSGSYSSAPEQVNLTGPVFSDLLPTDMTYVSSALVGALPGACNIVPDIYNIADYNSTGRTLVIWSWAGKACNLARGDTVTYDVVATVGAKTPGGTVQNYITFMGSDNPNTDARGTEGCNATTGGDLVNIIKTTNADYNPNAAARAATGTADEDRICHAHNRSFSVQRVTNISSRKAVKGTLDAAYLYNDGVPNIVGRSVHEGAVFWRLEINNTANVPLDNIEIIDIVPFDGSTNPTGDSNSGIGTGVPLGSEWSPEFVAPINLSTTPAGTKVYYTQAANPCRNNIVAVAGCNPMVTLADGVPLTDEATVPVANANGEWSTVLPNVPRRILAFRVVYPPAFVIQPGETLAFVNPMFIPLASPISDCAAAATDSCSEIAWNTFGFSYEEADIGLANSSAPTRVGIIVQPLTGTAALGDFVWFDTDKDGVQDADEMSNGVNFVLVELFKDPDGIPNNGDEVLLNDTRTRNHPTTNLPGYYHFANLGPTGANDRYIVRFHPPAGYDVSPADSLGNASNTPNDSDGILTNVAGVDLYQVSGITLSLGQDRPDIDQGIFIDPAKFSLGNRVWMDPNNDSTDNDGAGDALESGTGIAGVRVELWSVDNAGAPINGVADAFLTTNATGYYLFTNLDAGDYRLVIPASQLGVGQPLNALISSGTNATTLAEFVPVAGNSDRDVLDHGGLLSAALGAIANGSVISSVVTLGPLTGEPINEQGIKGQTQTPGYFDTTPNNRSNLSIDFGFLAAAGAPPPLPIPPLEGTAKNIPVLSNMNLFIMALSLALLVMWSGRTGYFSRKSVVKSG